MSSPADLPLTATTKAVLDLLAVDRENARAELNVQAQRLGLNVRQLGARLGFLTTAGLVEFRDAAGERLWRRKVLA